MRTKTKPLLVLALAFFAISLSQNGFSADPNVIDEMLLSAFSEERNSGSSAKVQDKFEAVLKADPNNYFALIKLGATKMHGSQGKIQDKKAMAEAVDYFLRATIAQPQNPEAFLYLAELYYKFGYITEGDSYARMAKTLSRHVIYDSVCLMGSRYEETGNYYAAVMTYAPAALADGSKFQRDPYLVKHLSQAASSAPPPYDWVYPVFGLLVGEKESYQVLDGARKIWRQRLAGFPEMVQRDFAELIVKMRLRALLVAILSRLQEEVEAGAKIPEKYEMPSLLYKHFFCSPEEIPSKPCTDPYEAFVMASFDSVQEQTRVLSELRVLRDEALKVVADEKSDVEKARKLFTWLKKRALVEYHALDGFSAKGVMDEKKYLCLSGAIVYTLLARDAKLNVCGVLEPGHAYASLNSDRKIRVETTTEGPEGFDIKREATSRENDRVLQLGPFAVYGEITEPMKFVANQFSNTAAFSELDLVLNKHEKLLKQAFLTDVLHWDEAMQADQIASWKKRGTMPFISKAIMKMAAADETFRVEMIRQFDKSIELLKKARGLSPFDLAYRNLIRETILDAAVFESLPAVVAEKERDLKRFKLGMKKSAAERAANMTSLGLKIPKDTSEEQETTDVAAIDAELAQLDQEAEESWEAEKKFWLKRVKRLSDATRDFPCDEKLQNHLTRALKTVQVIGMDRKDRAILDELRTYETSRQH